MTSSQTSLNVGTVSDLKSRTDKYILELWQSEWDEFPENKLHQIFPVLKECIVCPRTDRKEETVMAQLHNGHSFITLSFFFYFFFFSFFLFFFLLHRQIFALRNKRLTACHICIYSKSKITTYALRSSVFCFQNRLITEPVQDKGGQFAADFCIVFIYFVFQHQLLKEAGESSQAIVELAFVYKLLSLKYH